jgi:hypothetical protein
MMLWSIPTRQTVKGGDDGIRSRGAIRTFSDLAVRVEVSGDRFLSAPAQRISSCIHRGEGQAAVDRSVPCR